MNRFFFPIIVLVGTLTQISTDIYTPSLPAIAENLQSSLGQAQLTLTWFMLGIALTNLIYGPLSEVIGRRWTLILGNLIAISGTLICLFAEHIHGLQMGRFVQGLGLGACATLWRSILRDHYSGSELARIGAYLTNVVIVSVILAPFFGGYFEQYLGWRSSFVFLFFWTLMVTGVIAFLFQETGKHHGRHRLNCKFIFSTYAELLSSRVFMGMSLCVFASFGGLSVWITAGPVVLIHGARISPVLFGYLMILTGLSMGLGGFTNGKLVRTWGISKLMTLGWVLMSSAGLLILLAHAVFGNTVLGVIVPAMFLAFGGSFIFSNAVATAFTPFGHIAGYAGSLYACIQLLGGVISSALVSHLNTNSPVPMALMFMASGILSWMAFRGIVQD